MLREYYDTLVYNFSEEEVAVITVGEREREDMWKDVHTNFYEISSTAFTSVEAGKELLLTVNEIHRNSKIKAVILDSLSGCKNIISELPEMEKKGMETGGLKNGIVEYIRLAIIEPLRVKYSVEDQTWSRDRIVISSILFEEYGKAGITMLEQLRAHCDSEIYLYLDIARQGLFPSINENKTFSRRAETFCGDVLKRLCRKAKESYLESVIEAHK